ncbi:MAG: lysophospholipid acyltransferase family protein [Fidelibacterota bacterium]
MGNRLLFPLGLRLAGPVLALLFRLNRHKVVNSGIIERIVSSGKSVLVCCWHGRLLFPFYFLRGRGYYAVAGWHPDAEIISRTGTAMGWRMIRGSSSRGGTRAYQKMVDVLSVDGSVVAVTPDGPRGPRRKAKRGAVRTAARTGAVVVPVSGQATRRWDIINWDRFVVPKPLGKTVFVIGDPVEIGPHEAASIRRLERELDRVQEMADALSVSKT